MLVLHYLALRAKKAARHFLKIDHQTSSTQHLPLAANFLIFFNRVLFFLGNFGKVSLQASIK